MNIDIAKIESQAVLRLRFPSRTKAKRFVSILIKKYGYEVPEASAKNVHKLGLALLVYKKTIITTNLTDTLLDYSGFLIPVNKEPEPLGTKSLDVRGSTYYLTKDILDSDLCLRYYFYFYHRADYKGKYFVKCKKTKEYLEITEEQAQRVSREMCGTNSFVRVVGFKVKEGFRRVYIHNDGTTQQTLNGKAE